ncbi:hypothetical protein KEM55_006101, partial [Ascosphaera atra]
STSLSRRATSPKTTAAVRTIIPTTRSHSRLTSAIRSMKTDAWQNSFNKWSWQSSRAAQRRCLTGKTDHHCLQGQQVQQQEPQPQPQAKTFFPLTRFQGDLQCRLDLLLRTLLRHLPRRLSHPLAYPLDRRQSTRQGSTRVSRTKDSISNLGMSNNRIISNNINTLT